MSSTPPPGGRLLVEPLEARIAPTGLTAIANNPSVQGSTDPFYVTYGTAPSSTHLGFVKASQYLGAAAPANLYAIKLTGDGSLNPDGTSTGDKLLIFNATTGFNAANPSIQATNQSLIAYFQDTNGDGQVQANELVGLSLTKQTSASVNGSVNGDILTNLSKDGNTVSLTSVGKPGFSIGGLNINGNVLGGIYAGGDIDNVMVQGVVSHGILAGTATNGAQFNLSGVTGAVTGTLATATFKDLRAGASINNLSVVGVAGGDLIHAGDGGLGAVGGSVTGLSVLADTLGYNVFAGNGGVGNNVLKGGVGGDISGMTVVGVANTTANALINIHAGDGGADSAFKGGTGGTVTGLATSFALGFDATNNVGTQSPDLLTQNILVHAGDGGSGLKGGRGGDVTESSVFAAAPDDHAVVNGLANAEIQVFAGHGGLAIAADQGHGGKGGNIGQLNVESLDTTLAGDTSSILVQAGDGGLGKDGGQVSGVNVISTNVTINAGNGGSGLTGGPGGSLDTININSLTNLFTHELALNAGSGGISSASSGGLGGNVNNVTVVDSDLHDLPAGANGLLAQPALVINGGTHANGGVGMLGLGGAGGSVTDIQLTDSDISGGFATVAVRSGAGGDGYLGGGNGGNIGNASAPVQMIGVHFSASAVAGNGGNLLGNGGSGPGGAGGGLDTVGFSSAPTVDQVAVGNTVAAALGNATYAAEFATVIAGKGGTGSTTNGAGGSLASVNLRAEGNVAMTAGVGGFNGNGVGTGGAGGSITNSAGVSLGGSASFLAGDASITGSAAADGGGISGVVAQAQFNVLMQAGNGGLGGNGGDIANTSTGANPLFLSLTGQSLSNFGNVTITAGAGTSVGGVAGHGGSVTSFNGYIGLGGDTAITAGAGGGGNGQTASGAGGNVTSLQLFGTGSFQYFGGQTVTVDAGDAGVATAAKRGADGGEVSTVTIYNLDLGTSVQHVAAGDGSSAINRGGIGGTIDQVHVGLPDETGADIGLRDGAAFGYAPGSAGGLFAGVGGTGKKSTGVNGDVTNITATAISSIVAGKTGPIHLVNTVDGIDLAGNTAAVANADGSFANFDTANVLGGVQNPDAAQASTFKAGDGLVAALNFTMNRDQAPSALLTLDGAGTPVLVDYQQPNPTPVVTTSIPISFAL